MKKVQSLGFGVFKKPEKTFFQVLLLAFLFAVCATFQLSAHEQSKTVNLSERSSSLKAIFDQVEQQTGMITLFSNNELSMEKKVNVNKSSYTLEELYTAVLQGTQMEFEIKDPYIVIKPIRQEKVNKEKEQQKMIPIKGTVTDKEGVALPGVTVLLKGTSKGAISDSNGNYTIEVPDKTAVLSFSYLGFLPKEITVEENTEINLKMENNLTNLEEVVVGYGSVRKKDLTGSIAQVNIGELQKQNAFSLDVALTGRVSGVMVIKTSGAPGADASIRIRGASSIFGINEPLYVIDGVPIQIGQGMGMDDYRSSRSFQLSPLSSINPEDIESIDILKDASGTAIYGSRGANGVIQVTTKKGKGGLKPRLNVSYNLSVDQFVKDFKMLPTDEFVKVAKEAYFNYDGSNLPENFLIYQGTNTDWKKLATQASYSKVWNISLQGGSADSETIYALSASVNDQQGVINATDFKRYTLRGTIESEVVKMLKVGTNVNYTKNVTNGLSNTYYYNIVSYRPDVPVLDANGNYACIPDSTSANPVARTTYTNNVKNDYWLLSTFAEFRPVKELKIRSTFSYNQTQNTTLNYTPSYDPFEKRNGRRGSRKDIVYHFSSRIFDNTITYNKLFNNHFINAVAGASFTSDHRSFNTIESINFPDDKILNNLGSASSIQKYDSKENLSGLESYFFRGNYNYKGCYYATFTFRTDKSTKFGPNNQWGTFPSAALAWRISEEKFLNKSWLNDLKLRASIGKTGAANLGDFLYSTFFSTGGSYSFHNGESGVTPNSAPNPSIRWETTTQFDAGIDYSLFRNRLRGAIDIYRKYTKDLLLNVTIPNETGSSSQVMNVGDISNRGFEFVIGGDIVSQKDFQYTSDINLSFNRSRLEKLNDGWGTDLKEGDNLGSIYGYKTAGIFQTQEEINVLNAAAKPNASYYQNTKTSPGDIKFVDQNNDNYISTEDIVKLGSTEPTFYGGWNNVLRYKNIETSLLFYFSYGQLLYNAAKGNLGIYTTDKNYYREVLDAWSEDNKNAKHPRNVRNDPNKNARESDYLIQDGSFFKLKNVQVAYYLNPKRWAKVQLSLIKLYASVSNLFTITSYDGVDPEISTSLSGGLMAGGYDYGAYPSTRTFNLGINITF